MLWLYGHIVEAAEPYELLANLIDTAAGGGFNAARFPFRNRPPNPGDKIKRIRTMAEPLGLQEVAVPLEEAWDRELRNAIFHADYHPYNNEVRIGRPQRTYRRDEIMTIINRALARHEALEIIHRQYRLSYSPGQRIPAGERFASSPDDKAVVLVREGYGVIGIRHGYSPEQIAHGAINWSLGKYTPFEANELERNPYQVTFPTEKEQEQLLQQALSTSQQSERTQN